MSLLPDIAVMALRPLLCGMLEQAQSLVGDYAQQGLAAAPSAALQNVGRFLYTRFTDPSKKLPDALRRSADRAWRSLEVALAGESLWTRFADRGEDKALRQVLRQWLDFCELDTPFRRRCLEQLRAAGKAGLIPGELEPRTAPERTAHFARFGDPTRAREAEWRVTRRMAGLLRGAGSSDLADLLELQPPGHDAPVLAVAVRFFFRREIETDPTLFQGFVYSQVDQLSELTRKGLEGLAKAFDGLGLVLHRHGEDLEQILDGLAALHGDVRDMKGEVNRQGAGQDAIYREVLRISEKLERRHEPSLSLYDGFMLHAAEAEALGRRVDATTAAEAPAGPAGGGDGESGPREQGAESAYRLGEIYLHGEGVPKDEPFAAQCFRAAADQGHPAAQCRLAMMYQEGCGVPKDEAQAVQWYRKAAEQGNAQAQNKLGVMFAEGCGVCKDDAAAAMWFRRAAEQGNADPDAVFRLAKEHECGWIELANGVGVDFYYLLASELGHAVAPCIVGSMREESYERLSEAGKWYALAAERGNAEAAFRLGEMYQEGDGVEQDEATAAHWYLRAAENGHYDAPYMVGWMYENERGFPRDGAMAARWYIKAAEQGDRRGQHALGVMLSEGGGVLLHHARIVEWLRKAAEEGDADAEYRLGRIYETGRGVPKDEVAAVNWYRKAAERGHAQAQYDLAKMLQQGCGVGKDEVAAVLWYYEAAKHGSADAQNVVGLVYHQGRWVAHADADAARWFLMPLSDVNLSSRTGKDMNRLRITTLGDLIQYTADELRAQALDESSLCELREKLAQHGLSLRGD